MADKRRRSQMERGGKKGIRSFVAVEIPAFIRDEIAVVQREIDLPGVRLVNPDLIHVTVKFLGDVPLSKVDRVVEALRTVERPAFTARVAGIGAFPGRSIRVVWMGVEGDFEQLFSAVEEALVPLGFEMEGRRFTSHATIARVKSSSPETTAILASKLEPFKEIDLGEFDAEEFILKKSTLTPGGPIYEDVAAFPLSRP
ncbi:RNA 2',3'-cyclic phosphodiesterase [Candidatus Methanocrinis natronophilus]|uniref:RNA 2',3'-cyclic phosphodiesterase n=1 Tax=Candidatus Methanocrinis natronophilus TaxID=3033396 RepID=A0ABT5X6R2_9EURY|nr:RNA 2',3'-cyclic phosphodiesterase [Candidatus Methanocrinis natronophilus]MDF0590389.1 RNA 2',3'-cyclic phosphodiesterase [Candidatus Methanocrinis natronophilus]